MRILVLIAIGLLLYIIIGNYLRQQRKRPSEPEIETEKMVRCQHCGLHILEQEAIKNGADYYCSKSHLEADRSAK